MRASRNRGAGARRGEIVALALLGIGLGAAALAARAQSCSTTASPTTSSASSTASAPPPRSSCPADLAPAPPAGDSLTFVGAHAGTPGMPTVRGEYEGCAFAVLVDTGVGGNAFMGWFAREMHLEARLGTTVARDMGGATATVLEVAPSTLHVLGIQTGLPITMVMPSGDRLRGYGIGAVISPRYTVAVGRALLLEFGERSLMRNLALREAEALHAGTSPTFDLNECEGHFQARAWVADREARLEIDTGSMATVIYTESDAGRELPKGVTQWGQSGRGAVGAPGLAGRVDGVPIRVGALSVTATVEAMLTKGNVEGSCGFDGVLGADFLVAHRCMLLAEVERMRGWCEP